MSEIKGGEWVLELAKMMRNQKIKFVMVGVDKINFKCPSNVILIERTNNQDELASLYSMADVFVICSKMENFPTTCLEAQCCGTPICGFDVGGTKETTLFKKDFFVKYGDLDALKNIIEKQLQNNMMDKKDFSNHSISVYSREAMFEKYLLLYKNTR